MTQIGVAMQQADVAIWQNSYYIQATYCRLGNFCVKNNSCENFCGVKFSWFVRSAKFFNGWWLRCGWAPGEFLLVLPGIGRARYCWLCIVVVLIFTSGGVDLRAYLSIDHHCASFFFVCLIFAVGHDREIILTAKFSQSTVLTHIQCIYVLLACRPCNANPLSEA